MTPKTKTSQVELPATNAIRLISKAEVCDRVGKTFPTIWLWMRQGKFPQARDCGGRPAWVESEIDAWIAALPVREYKPTKNSAAA